MPKDLKAAIRLGKFQVDECRRAVGELQRQDTALEAQQQALEEEFAREQAAALGMQDMAFTVGAYVTHFLERRHGLQQQRLAIQATLEIAQEQLAEAFRALKTLEIGQENRERQEALEQERKDQSVADELGLTLHRRKQSDTLGGERE